MRVQALRNPNFIVDIAQGDIFEESGDFLISGKPKGLRCTSPEIHSPDVWETVKPCPHHEFSFQQCRLRTARWNELYSLRYHANSRARMPMKADEFTMKYWRVRSDLELLMFHLRSQGKFDCNAVLGIAPLSWRNPEIVAHAIAEAVAGLFFSYNFRSPKPESLTVIIRSLDEPSHLWEVFTPKYFKDFRRRIGYPRNLCDIWSPA